MPVSANREEMQDRHFVSDGDPDQAAMPFESQSGADTTFSGEPAPSITHTDASDNFKMKMKQDRLS